MKKTLGVLAVLMLLAPAAAFADSTVSASAGTGATISPSGTTVVATGVTQTFSIGATQGFKVTSVSVDGTSEGAVNSVGFTGLAGDLVDHTISVSAQSQGGTEPWCSSPTAPGWQVGLVGGGCGGTSIFVPRGQTMGGFTCPDAFVAGCILP